MKNSQIKDSVFTINIKKETVNEEFVAVANHYVTTARFIKTSSNPKKKKRVND